LLMSACVSLFRIVFTVFVFKYIKKRYFGQCLLSNIKE